MSTVTNGKFLAGLAVGAVGVIVAQRMMLKRAAQRNA